MQRFARLALVGLLGGVAVAVPLTPAPAQGPGLPPGQFPSQVPAQIPPASPDGVEVLTRGPVHEAFASTAEMPTAGPVVTQLPPNPVEELPPDQKPEGDNVQWVPGYWHFDEDRTDFIWVSGFWRVPPPGRVWLPGSWREVPGGRQWVHGFWQEVVPAAAQQPQALAQQLEYLPPPPQPLELSPSVPQPDSTSFYVAGSWMWRGRYVWRPGYWVAHRPDWVWVPAHFRATPGGYLFIDGYWDYPLERRGVLFAPVYFTPVVLNRRAFVYTPAFAVSNQGLYGALFVRRGWSSYYFGDYFEPRYTTLGFNAWCGSPRGSGFAVTVGFGRGVAYDPLWNYYQVQHRSDPVFVANIHDTYAGRFRGDVPRPPRTLVQQTTVVNNITNVTNVTNVNNTTVNNKTVNNTVINKAAPVNINVTNLTMVQPLKSVPQSNTNVVLKAVAKDEQVKEQQIARQTRDVGVQRGRAETQLADRQLAPAQQTDKPRQVKLDVPQTVAARAQAPEAPRYAPPPKPTPQSAELNAKAPATIPPAKEGKPEAPARINPIPVTPPAPTPTTMVPAPVAKDPKNPRTPAERDPKTVANPEPKAPVAPMPVAPAPVARDAKAPVMPAPTPVTPAPVVRDPKSPATPAPVAPIPVPRPTPGNAEVKNPGRPVPAPTNPEVKPAPMPAVPPPQPPKLGVPPVPVPAPAKPVPLPPMTPVTPMNPPKSLPPPAPVAPAPLPPARPEVKVPPVNIPPARPDVKVPPVNVPPAPPAKLPPGKQPPAKDPKDRGEANKPGQPGR